SNSGATSEKKAGAGQAKNEAAKAGDDAAAKGDKKADADAPAEIPPDPSQTLKEVPVEIFKDRNAEEILEPKNFNPIRNPPRSPAEIAAVKAMAADPNAPVDTTVIRRV